MPQEVHHFIVPYIILLLVGEKKTCYFFVNEQEKWEYRELSTMVLIVLLFFLAEQICCKEHLGILYIDRRHGKVIDLRHALTSMLFYQGPTNSCTRLAKWISQGVCVHILDYLITTTIYISAL